MVIVLAYIYVYILINCHELPTYTELLIYIDLSKMARTCAIPFSFKELSLAGRQHLFVSRV